MTELLPSDLTGVPVGYVDDEGDIHPLDDDDIDRKDLLESDNITIEDTPYPERKERPVLLLPDTLDENRKRIRIADLAQQAFEPTPYEEYGGGISQYNRNDASHYYPLDDVIRASEPWQTEITTAVEQFGMNELSVEQYMAMSDTQKEAFSRHFAEYYKALIHRPNFIETTTEGLVEHNDYLRNLYGAERTQEELLTYSQRLRKLIHLLNDTGIPKKVDEYVHVLEKAGRSGHRNTRLSKVNYHDYQIGFRPVKDGRKKPMRFKTT